MNQRNASNRGLTRRQWVVLATSTLAGCGGGTSSASLPGTGGTGIFAQGTISGFGSVIVNRIKFDDSAATVLLNGVVSTAADLRLGMVAEVQGLRNAGDALGTAHRIEVWSIAQGYVEQVQPGQFVVAGMVLQTDASTVFDGVSSVAALAVGMPVVGWGLQVGADGNRWTATRVALVSNITSTISTGLVAGNPASHKVNGLSMAGTAANSLSEGQMVQVQGSLANTGLRVDTVRILGLQSATVSQGELEIEGMVTSVISTTRFRLGNQEVDASGAANLSLPTTVALGSRVQVRGSLEGSVVKATTLEVQTAQKLDKVEIDAKIEQFTSVGNFTVRGQRCDASTAKITKGRAAELKVGVRVKLEGTKAGDVVNVTSLEINA